MKSPKEELLDEAIEIIESVISLLDCEIYFSPENCINEKDAYEILEGTIGKIRRVKKMLNNNI